MRIIVSHYSHSLLAVYRLRSYALLTNATFLSIDHDDIDERDEHISVISPPLALPLLETFVVHKGTYLESPTETLMSDENFEEAFREAGVLDEAGRLSDLNDSNDEEDETSENEDYADIAKYEIVEVVGDDSYGRKVITIYACRLPSNKELNHNRLLK